KRLGTTDKGCRREGLKTSIHIIDVPLLVRASFKYQIPLSFTGQYRACMKISARNQIRGTIVDIQKGVTTADVRVDIGGGVIVTSSITNEAVDDLGLASGQVVSVVIKASDVMIGVPQ